MMVVADAGPLRYLIVIEAADVLRRLYDRVLLPETVAAELQAAPTPAAVRAWLLQPPAWCETRPDPPADPALAFLDPGERAAITLALAVHAARVLMDDWDGRAEAERRDLRVTGTLGVLAEAHQRNLHDFEAALTRLRQTNFYLSDSLVERVRRILSAAVGKP